MREEEMPVLILEQIRCRIRDPDVLVFHDLNEAVQVKPSQIKRIISASGQRKSLLGAYFQSDGFRIRPSLQRVYGRDV